MEAVYVVGHPTYRAPAHTLLAGSMLEECCPSLLISNPVEWRVTQGEVAPPGRELTGGSTISVQFFVGS